jgi:NitT/TauT family transport system ATP-binding protein
VNDSPDLTNIYDISNEVGKEFGETISLVKAAEILELVDTPKNDVRLTELGRRFLASDHKGRTRIFAEQVNKLRLFHIILEYLKVQDKVDVEKILKDISMALPYDNPDKALHTMVAWGRYGGLMDYNADAKTIFVPKDDESEAS